MEKDDKEASKSNLAKLTAGIIFVGASILPLAGCEVYTSYSTYPSYSPHPRIYVAPQPRYYSPQPRYYNQRPFNNGPYGNLPHRNYPQQRQNHPQQRHSPGPRGHR